MQRLAGRRPRASSTPAARCTRSTSSRARRSRRHRLPGRAAADGQLRHPVRRRHQDHALRRRRAVLRHAHRPRPGVAAVAAVQPPGRPHRQGRAGGRRQPAREGSVPRRPRRPAGRRLMPQFIYTMKGLGKVHPPDHEVLKDIWLSFFPGAKIGVLGLNGSGKSSLLRIMAGVDTRLPRRGRSSPQGMHRRLPAAGAAARSRRRRCARTSRRASPATRALLERFDEINAKLRRGPVARRDGQAARGAGQGAGQDRRRRTPGSSTAARDGDGRAALPAAATRR